MIAKHAVATPEGKILNVRYIGGVTIEQNMFRGLTNGKLNKTRFNIFSIEIPLHQILGCKKGKALKQLKNAAPSTVGGDKLQYMYKHITNKKLLLNQQVAKCSVDSAPHWI